MDPQLSSHDSIPSVATGPDDFLFHLYRGSEMLLNDRVVEAKGELEKALGLQPQDAKSQDLLAGVYFRLGLYPRAIEIWQQLVRTFPRDPTLRVNLSLALFKTGQADDALQHVHEALRIQPDHSKAWGYMGLIHWRRGQLEEARGAFLRGGQAAMARRMEQELDGRGTGETRAVTPRPEDEAELVGSLRSDVAPSDLDAIAAQRREQAAQSSATPVAATFQPPTLAEIVRDWTATFPTQSALALGTQGELLLHAETALYVREVGLTAVRGALESEPVARRAQGTDTEETLGGERPIRRWRGPVSAVAHPQDGERFIVLALDEAPLYVREGVVVAFEHQLSFESATLPLGAASGAFTQLRGNGRVALLLSSLPTGVAVSDEAVRLAPERLVGWTGRLFPSADGERLVFRGEGVVLVR
ncbi:MAG: tetratricopeptide repeat protein [Polyangiales bacterium]